MKIFGYRDNYGNGTAYGITCGIIIADSEQEAKEIIDFSEDGTEEIFEIPFEKGYKYIGSYSE